ncbi:MAG: GNAT family N-acetyltransferase [Chloroflexi bacterium]|nr:GNAT family N-acetyltransferase [Chloroflexota bacterium]
MNKQTTRLASPEDAAILAKLNRHVHQIHVDLAPAYFKMHSLTESIARFNEMLTKENAHAWITFVGDTAVAYILIRIMEREEGIMHRQRRWLYIDQISVEPKWKGHGFGRNLVDTVLQFGRDQGLTEVDVSFWAFNRESRAFFYRLGFQPQIERLHMKLD